MVFININISILIQLKISLIKFLWLINVLTRSQLLLIESKTIFDRFLSPSIGITIIVNSSLKFRKFQIYFRILFDVYANWSLSTVLLEPILAASSSPPFPIHEFEANKFHLNNRWRYITNVSYRTWILNEPFARGGGGRQLKQRDKWNLHRLRR